MASCIEIITLALSKLGVAGGTKTPRQTDLDLGLQTLQSTFRMLISSGMLGRANPVAPQGDYTAQENDRIFRTSSATGSITIPELVHDCDRHYNIAFGDYYDDPYSSTRTRPPRDGAFIIINDATTGNSVQYIYEGFSNRWISVHDLSLDPGGDVLDINGLVVAVNEPSIAPLSMRDANGLAALLATKLADHYAATLMPSTVRDAVAYQVSLSNRFGESEGDVFNDLF